MFEYEYYEYVAAEICGTEAENLWVKTRKKEIVLARQFCMKYRVRHEKLSLRVAAERYGQDHATASHAIKTILHYIKTKDLYGDFYQKFIKRCEAISHIKKTNVKKNNLNETAESINRRISNQGWKNYIDESKDILCQLFLLFDNDGDEADIRAKIDSCVERLCEIKYLYANDQLPELQD